MSETCSSVRHRDVIIRKLLDSVFNIRLGTTFAVPEMSVDTQEYSSARSIAQDMTYQKVFNIVCLAVNPGNLDSYTQNGCNLIKESDLSVKHWFIQEVQKKLYRCNALEALIFPNVTLLIDFTNY
jgi:hypothetical protein